jgi:hypothetical protein
MAVMAVVMSPVTAIRHVIGKSETTVETVSVFVSHAADIDHDISVYKIYLDSI